MGLHVQIRYTIQYVLQYGVQAAMHPTDTSEFGYKITYRQREMTAHCHIWRWYDWCELGYMSSWKFCGSKAGSAKLKLTKMCCIYRYCKQLLFCHSEWVSLLQLSSNTPYHKHKSKSPIKSEPVSLHNVNDYGMTHVTKIF